MFLNQRQIKQLGELMATLAEPLEEADVRMRIGEQMLQLLDAQFYASFVWDSASATFGRAVTINMDPGNLANYERYYQFHDPITRLMQAHRSAVRATDVLSHELLKRTEFFNDFLARDGLHWGTNLYAWDGDQNIGDMRIWRDRKREDFSNDDLEVLDLIRPAFIAALRRSRHAQIATALPQKGSALDILSEREIDVARLISCGLSDKEIARRLALSTTTVRTHISHAFRKHGVDSRIQLLRALGL